MAMSVRISKGTSDKMIKRVFIYWEKIIEKDRTKIFNFGTTLWGKTLF